MSLRIRVPVPRHAGGSPAIGRKSNHTEQATQIYVDIFIAIISMIN